MSSGTDRQSIYFMPTRLSKDKIDRFCVPQFQLVYICDTTHTSHNLFVKLCHEVHNMWWENQFLELQEWEDFTKSNKRIILSITMIVPNNNPQRYKGHVIFFIAFDCVEGVTII